MKAAADPELSPVILIPEDFSTKQGPLFRNDFLDRFHYPYVKMLTETWHRRDLKVLYHSDGSYKKAVPDLLECGVDGFYCLEPSCGMFVASSSEINPPIPPENFKAMVEAAGEMTNPGFSL